MLYSRSARRYLLVPLDKIGENLPVPFDRIAGRDDVFSFARELSSEMTHKFRERKQETLDTNIGLTADCLRILKHSIEIAISMMKSPSSSRHVITDIASLVSSVSYVSEFTLALDGLMLFSADGDAVATKPVKTLTELLAEADKTLEDINNARHRIMAYQLYMLCMSACLRSICSCLYQLLLQFY